MFFTFESHFFPFFSILFFPCFGNRGTRRSLRIDKIMFSSSGPGETFLLVCIEVGSRQLASTFPPHPLAPLYSRLRRRSFFLERSTQVPAQLPLLKPCSIGRFFFSSSAKTSFSSPTRGGFPPVVSLFSSIHYFLLLPFPPKQTTSSFTLAAAPGSSRAFKKTPAILTDSLPTSV